MTSSIESGRTIGYGGLALMTGLCRRTLERYRAAGIIPGSAVVKYTRAVRFKVSEIEKWLASRTGADFPPAVKAATKSKEQA